MFVDTFDGDFVIAFQLKGDTLGGTDLDRVGKTNGKADAGSGLGRTVTGTNEFEVFGEPLCDAGNEIGKKGAVKAVEGAVVGIVGAAGESDSFAIDGNFYPGRNLLGKITQRSGDRKSLTLLGEGDGVGQLDGLFTN